MHWRAGTYLAVIAASLAACNQPAVTPKLPAFQSSENTVRDWNDVADKIASQLAGNGLIAPPGPPGADTRRPIYIRLQAPDSAFLQAVATRLELDILQSGGTVSRSSAGATVVNLNVDFVSWGPRDKPPGLMGTTAGILSIPAIVIGASAPMSTWAAADAAAFTAIGVGMFADAAIAMTPTMNAEAIWSATVVTDDRVVMKVTEPVYIRAPDIPLYAKSLDLAPSVSWSGRGPLPVRRLRYDP